MTTFNIPSLQEETAFVTVQSMLIVDRYVSVSDHVYTEVEKIQAQEQVWEYIR